MLKLLVFVLLVAAVIFAFTRRAPPNRPPRDQGPDRDPDPAWPAGRIGRDPPAKESSHEINEMISGVTGAGFYSRRVVGAWGGAARAPRVVTK